MEIWLRNFQYGIDPTDDQGGKRLNLFHPPGQIYVITVLPKDTAESIAKMLLMSNEELQEHNDRKNNDLEIRQSLADVERELGNGHGSSPSF